jgi:hypothetical protein
MEKCQINLDTVCTLKGVNYLALCLIDLKEEFLLKFNSINQNKLWTKENEIIKMQVLGEPENMNLVKFILLMNLLERKFMDV